MDRPDILNRELSPMDRRKRVVNIPRNEDSVSHVRYVWDTIIKPSPATKIHFACTSYGGYGIARLLDLRAHEILPRLGGIAMVSDGHVCFESRF